MVVVRQLVCLLPNFLKLFGFPTFPFERTRWKLFQKRVVLTKFDIYVFIKEKSQSWTTTP